MPRSILPLALIATACAAAPDEPQCPDAHAAGEWSVFSAGLGPTEGIAFSDDGRLFVSAGERIIEVFPNGTHREFAEVTRTVGLAWWKDALYVASADDGSGVYSSFCAPGNRGAVWRVSRDGEVTRFATGILAPNFLAVTPWDTLLVSDDCPSNTRIYEVNAAGETRVWSDGVPSANGLAFDLERRNLLAVSTFTSPPPLWRIPLAGQEAEAPGEVLQFEPGSSPDGVALAADGSLFVALNTSSEIHRIVDGVAEPFATGLMTPASIAFGEGAFDGCSLYATSLFGKDLYRINAGVRGAPLPR